MRGSRCTWQQVVAFFLKRNKVDVNSWLVTERSPITLGAEFSWYSNRNCHSHVLGINEWNEHMVQMGGLTNGFDPVVVSSASGDLSHYGPRFEAVSAVPSVKEALVLIISRQRACMHGLLISISSATDGSNGSDPGKELQKKKDSHTSCHDGFCEDYYCRRTLSNVWVI